MDDLLALKEDICKVCHLEMFDTEIEFVESIRDRSIELADTPSSEAVAWRISESQNLNGQTICPYNGTRFHILISKVSPHCKGGFWMGTVAHEMTHVNDIALYLKEYGLRNYEEMAIRDDYDTFFVFTEIHAYKNGANYLQWLACKGNFSDSWKKETKLVYEQGVLNELVKPIQENLTLLKQSGNLERYLYDIARVIGKLLSLYSIYGELETDIMGIFQEEYLPMKSLYDELKNSTDFHTFKIARRKLMAYTAWLKKEFYK